LLPEKAILETFGWLNTEVENSSTAMNPGITLQILIALHAITIEKIRTDYHRLSTGQIQINYPDLGYVKQTMGFFNYRGLLT